MDHSCARPPPPAELVTELAMELDAVEMHCRAAGIAVAKRCLLVEGTSDVEYFELAARLEYAQTGVCLLDESFRIVAAGRGDRGGVDGVVRELITLRNMAQYILTPGGKQKYKFAGLFDNDFAGQRAITQACSFDSGIVEFRDVFRLWPEMPIAGINDPVVVKNKYSLANGRLPDLNWELEDFLPADMFADFGREYPRQIRAQKMIGPYTHYELSKDGKENFRRHVLDNAMHSDVRRLIDVIRALRFSMNAQKI